MTAARFRDRPGATRPGTGHGTRWLRRRWRTRAPPSGRRVGAYNTTYEGGTPCTLNNPCEVAPDGITHVETGAAYAQQTWWIYTCLTNRAIDLNKSGCLLPKPVKQH
jgi:hypothetical protein